MPDAVTPEYTHSHPSFPNPLPSELPSPAYFPRESFLPVLYSDTITSSFAGDRSSLGHKTSASSASYEPSSAAKSSSRRKRLPRLIPPGRHCATRKRHSTGASWGLAPNRPERERTPPSQAQPPPPTHTPPHQEPYSLPLARRPTRSHALPPHTQRLAAPPAVRAHPIPHAWHGVSLPIWTRS
eukprot:scaffold2830_cov123-Isochrysis_galbana.AAC.26